MQRSPEYPFISRPVADVPDVLTGPEIHIPRSAAVDSNAKYILSKDNGHLATFDMEEVARHFPHPAPPLRYAEMATGGCNDRRRIWMGQ
jgi:hypothetical protein